jgi:hypothetical protein
VFLAVTTTFVAEVGFGDYDVSRFRALRSERSVCPAAYAAFLIFADGSVPLCMVK